MFSVKGTRISPAGKRGGKRSFRNLLKCWQLYVFLLPALLYIILFVYKPMYGILIAFKDFRIGDGIWGSEWVGLKHYIDFFNNPDAWRIIRNTLLLGVYTLLHNGKSAVLDHIIFRALCLCFKEFPLSKLTAAAGIDILY